jgi:hypothetical protein
LHQWSLNKTAPRERVADRKKLAPEKKPNLETMAPVPGMFDVFLNHTAAAAILLLGFFIVAFSTIAFAGHFSAREVDSEKLVPKKKPQQFAYDCNKAQMMPSETDELHEPLFQTVGTFLKALFYWRDFAKKRK